MTEVLVETDRASVAQTHARWVRISHWILTVSVLTLGFSGFVILMAHPRLYWGETGNDLTPALFELPISRNYQHGGWDKPTPFFKTGAQIHNPGSSPISGACRSRKRRVRPAAERAQGSRPAMSSASPSVGAGG